MVTALLCLIGHVSDTFKGSATQEPASATSPPIATAGECLSVRPKGPRGLKGKEGSPGLKREVGEIKVVTDIGEPG